MSDKEVPCKGCITFATCRNKLKGQGSLYNSLIRFAYKRCPILLEYIQVNGVYNYYKMDKVIRLARGYGDLCE